MWNRIKVYESLIENLCEELNNVLKKVPDEFKENIEEIRIRNARPLSVYSNGSDYFVSNTGKVTNGLHNVFIVNKSHINNTFQLISNYSVYAYREEIKSGYITIKGGHRVGIGGKVIYGSDGLETIRDISSLNIRVGREKIGVSDKIVPYLLEDKNIFCNTLIISPPQCGKTTLLRDMVRNLSDGVFSKKSEGFKISVIDERSEIAGMYKSFPQKNIGIRTDVLDGCLKSDGIMMAIRSMSPEIIAVDEIGGKRDVETIQEALRAGIKLIATAHGNSLSEVMGKPSMKVLLDDGVFERYIILDRSNGVGTIRDIIDGKTNLSIYD